MWTYNQRTGELSSADGVLATGYSGAPGAKNDPEKQDLTNVGPIPRGTYTVGVPFTSDAHGPWAMRLTPDPTNEMYGRAGFLMHGDSVEHPGAASEGCIIMPRDVRKTVWNSDDHQLVVI